MKKYVFGFLTLVAIACTPAPKVTRLPNGVVVSVSKSGDGGARLVRAQVVSDEIIRISALPGDSFPADKSLITSIQAPDSIPFQLDETDQELSLSTRSVTVKIKKQTGEVGFFDPSGTLLLREQKGGGKTFEPIEVDGDKGYSFRQVFESPDDEAFYGLGQHQSDEFNYKGRNEVLFQYNTKVSVPFIMSSRQYGLLWDNYSLTRFGNPSEPGQLSQFALFDEAGQKGALTASYYTRGDTANLFVKRPESEIDYENLETVKRFPERFNMNNSLITWTGYISPKESGLFNFLLYYAGYTKLFIDGKEVVAEHWRTAWNPNTCKFWLSLEKGKKYAFRLEWRPDGGTSYIGVKAYAPVDPAEQEKLSFWSEMGDMVDYYFVYGETPDRVVGQYRKLTGKSPIMPKWAMGYWQSRERYKTSQELLDVIAQYREKKIPLDNIVLDWFYWNEDSWGSHEFDATRFADPRAMVDQVHKMNAHIMISVWPKFYASTGHYREFDEKGWMYRLAVKDEIRDWVGRGYVGSFYDAYHPEARQLFWNQMKDHLYGLGFDAWWMDASEPDILSNASLAYRKQLSTPTHLGSSTRYLNTYALMNAQAIYEGQRGVDPDKRVFLLTRSGFAGLQRYATATWSGDIGTRWEDMKAQISAGLNFSMSGIPYWTMDIGGFCVERRYERPAEGSEDLNEWRELNARWHQFGAFCPLYRSHGQFPYREIFNIAPEGSPAYESMVYFNRLRYRLMPYVYSLAGMTWLNDYTLMRSLFMDFPTDTAVRNIGDQFLFGPALMVCPVSQYGARQRNVYFPKAALWYDFYTGTAVEPGTTRSVAAPMEQVPLFVRSGSILPVGPEIQYAAEKPADKILIYIYAGENGSFTLYEDEGTNYQYENGASSLIPFSWDDAKRILTIGSRVGSFEGMVEERIFEAVLVSKDKPLSFDPDRKANVSVKYSGTPLYIKF